MKRIVLGLAVAAFVCTQALAQYNPYSWTAPSAVTLSAPYPVFSQVPVQGCGSGSSVNSAITSASGLASTAGALYFGGGACVISANISVSKPVVVAAGTYFQPASGVTITFTGPVQAGAYQICNTSSGGHCDFSDIPNPAYVEWWGAVGGSTDYNIPTANATANTTAWTEALAYMPKDLLALNCGYSVTGVVLDGTKPRRLVGCGPGTYALIGSGIAFAYAASLPAGDVCRDHNVVLQNGVSPEEFQQLEGFGVTTNSASVIAVGICANNSTGDPTLMWQINASNSTFGGRIGASPGAHTGWLWEWANRNVMINNSYFGGTCAESFNLPNVGGTNTAIQKVSHFGGDWAGTNDTTAVLICQTNTHGSAIISNNSWTAGSFEFADKVATLRGLNQVFINPWMERITTVTPAVTETTGFDSHWIQPRANFAIVAGLLGLSSSSTATIGSSTYINMADQVLILSGAGSPNSAVSAGRGSVYYRTDSSDIAETPCYQFSVTPANTGWANGAGASC